MFDVKCGKKKSTIKKILFNKVSDWINSIDDKLVRSVVKENTIVTGGSIASMLLGEKVNDYDIYFKTKETVIVLANYYAKKFKENTGCKTDIEIIDSIEKNIKGEEEERVLVKVPSSGILREDDFEVENFDKYRPVCITQNAITLSGDIQLIIRFFGNVSDIHRNFDFVHATNYYDYDKNNLVLNQEALECLLSRTLVYRGSLYPIASLFRLRKFISRGWRVSAGEQLKIAWQISELNLKDADVLNDQLIGVDMAFMTKLIYLLSSEPEENLDSGYVCQLIDSVFYDEDIDFDDTHPETEIE